MMELDLVYPQFLLPSPQQQHLLAVEIHLEILVSIGKKLGGVRVTIQLKSYAAKVVLVRKKLYTVQNSGKHFDIKKIILWPIFTLIKCSEFGRSFFFKPLCPKSYFKGCSKTSKSHHAVVV